MIKKHKAYIVIFICIIFAVFAGLIWLFFKEDMLLIYSALKKNEIHPGFITLCFLILPLTGFPISPLLILMGLRFNTFTGVFLTLLIMPIHLIFSFWVVHSFFRSRLEAFAREKKYNFFKVPPERYISFGFLFMAMPGLPYTLKNYLLPISGIPFFHYLIIGWLVQGGMAVPMVILGDAASNWNVRMLLLFVIFYMIIYFVTRRVELKYKQIKLIGEK